MQLPLFKTCVKCGKTKFLTEFAVAKYGKFGRRTECKACSSMSANTWRMNNKERVNVNMKNWREANKERHKQLQEQSYLRNIDKRNAYHQNYRKQNKDAISEKRRAKYELDKEHIISKVVAWQRSHKENRRVQSNKRRAAKQGAESSLSLTQWDEILSMYSHSCCYCSSKSNITQDHWIPLSRGGKHSKDNVVPACRSCNSRKGKMTGDEYFARLNIPSRRLFPPQ